MSEISSLRSRGAVVVVLASVLASMVAVGAAHAAWHHLKHRPGRDTVAFQLYVDRNIDGWRSSGKRGVPQRDRHWAIAHAGVVLREGEQACDWLSRRPSPDRDSEGRYDVDSLIGAYMHDRSARAIADVDPMSRRYITAGAWSFLCRGVRDDRVVARPEGD